MTSLENKVNNPHGGKMKNVIETYEKEVTSSILIEKQLPEEIYQETMDIYTYVSLKASYCLSIIKTLKIEVIAFIYVFAVAVRNVSSTTMIMEKVCRVHFDLSSDVCDNLKLYPDWKTEVEKITNNYNMGHHIIGSLPAGILICFIGPWSDIYGRKLPIIISLAGMILDCVGSIICAYFLYSRAEYYIVMAFFTGLTGGHICMLTVCYSYVSDTTSFGMRTLKFAILQIASEIGSPLGALAGGWIFKYSNYVSVFSTSLAGQLVCLFCIIVIMDETKGIGNTDSWKMKIRQLFSCKMLLDGIKATMKPRPNRGRKQIWLLMFCAGVIILSYSSTAGINYLYAHHRFDWDNAKFSTVTSMFSIIDLVVMMTCVPLMTRVFKFGDPTLGIVGVTSLVAENFTTALSSQEWIFYLAGAVGFLSSTSTLAGRSRISKIVSRDDLGKVFAFVTTAEMLVPYLASALFSQLFNATLAVYPGLVYLVLCGLLSLSFAVYVWLAFLPSVDYEKMTEENEQEISETPIVKEKHFH